MRVDDNHLRLIAELRHVARLKMTHLHGAPLAFQGAHQSINHRALASSIGAKNHDLQFEVLPGSNSLGCRLMILIKRLCSTL
jgi:hypothetical protein